MAPRITARERTGTVLRPSLPQPRRPTELQKLSRPRQVGCATLDVLEPLHGPAFVPRPPHACGSDGRGGITRPAPDHTPCHSAKIEKDERSEGERITLNEHRKCDGRSGAGEVMDPRSHQVMLSWNLTKTSKPRIKTGMQQDPLSFGRRTSRGRPSLGCMPSELPMPTYPALWGIPDPG